MCSICCTGDWVISSNYRKGSKVIVEKSVFSIWVDLFLCRSIQLLVLSYAEMFVYMYLSQLMSTFTKLSKGASSSRWFLHSMTRRTSDPTITHMYLYTHVSQIWIHTGHHFPVISFPHWHLSSVLFYITCIFPVFSFPSLASFQ